MTPKPTILSRHKLTTYIAAGATVIVLATGGYAIANSGSSSSSANATTDNVRARQHQVNSCRLEEDPTRGRDRPPEEPPARSTACPTPSFTISTSAGQRVTVNKASSTTYQNGTNSTSASAITKGESVLVLGTTNGTTITASPGHRATGMAAGPQPLPRQGWFPSSVVPRPRQSRSVRSQRTTARGREQSSAEQKRIRRRKLRCPPTGGVVDRVVKLSNGEYEVHNIGVNWPHHIFVNQGFKVVGAN